MKVKFQHNDAAIRHLDHPSDQLRPFSAFLDIVRATAAIAVFMEHLRAALFRGIGELPTGVAREPSVLVLYFLAGFGFEAVVVFFVLSGYLVGGLSLGRFREGTFRFSNYSVDRATRLFVVFLPGLILTVVLDNIGAHFTNAGFWTAQNPILLEKFSGNFLTGDNLERFACNAAMLQSFACPVLGSNVPLWTLSYEFWFYTVFALALLFVSRNGPPRWIAFALGTGLIAFLGYKFVVMLAVWCAGLAVYLYQGTKLRRPVISIGCFLASAMLSRAINAGEPNGKLQDLVILLEGLSFAWVLISVRELNSTILVRAAPLARKIAGFSYSLYLIHFPTMLLVIALVYEAFNIEPSSGVQPNSAGGLAIYFLAFAIVMCVAWAFAAVTEAHTDLARRWLRASLSEPRLSGR